MKANAFQLAVIAAIVETQKTVRGIENPEIVELTAADVQPFAPAYYKIDPASYLFCFKHSPNPIEIFSVAHGLRVGALPTISTYNERNREPNANKGGKDGVTTMDALNFSDLYKNVRGFRVPVAPVPAVNVALEQAAALQG